jgi:cupin 2 domain-containing protein
MTDVVRGRLLEPSAAPVTGEHAETVVRVRNLVVEQVLSGRVRPVDYLQDDDEWAIVLAGRATLAVAGERVELGAGEWVLLPAGTPHRLIRTDPGTNWLTVKLGPDERA